MNLFFNATSLAISGAYIGRNLYIWGLCKAYAREYRHKTWPHVVQSVMRCISFSSVPCWVMLSHFQVPPVQIRLADSACGEKTFAGRPAALEILGSMIFNGYITRSHGSHCCHNYICKLCITHLVGGDWNMTGLFFHILRIIIPIDVHIFQRGSNHQPGVFPQ